MLLTNLVTKTVRDRWVGAAVTGVAISAFLMLAMAAYRGIDISLYTDLPESMQQLFGFDGATDAGGLAYGAILSFIGAIAAAGSAISMGSGSIAGEERAGTIGLLLSNPKSRATVLNSKAAATVILVAFIGVLLLVGALLSPAVLDVDTSGQDPAALVVHLTANALFWGMLAHLVGALTGNTSTASGVAGGLMIISWFAVSLIPLFDGWENLARVFPWYYFSGSDPLNNGVDLADLGVLTGASLAFGVAAMFGLERRDLKERSVATKLIDRLRQHPLTAKATDVLAGRGMVHSISTLNASRRQGRLIVCLVILTAISLIIGPLYNALDDTLKEFSDSLPESLMAMVGTDDLSTPDGWYQTQTFSLVVPIIAILLTTVVGARALAGEEDDGTIGLLLANPVSRHRVVAENALTMVVFAAIFGVVTFLSTWLGSAIGGLGIDLAHIAAAASMASLLGLGFGGLSLLLSALTGRVAVANYGTAGAAFLSFVVASFFPLNDSLEGVAKLSPWYAYVSSPALLEGIDWADAGALTAMFIALTGAALPVFARRDLR